ncbi:RNA-dependent RNA polymerase [Hubei narna-like virus 15]|uniref:RNA-dependent RNA polymerase n=1 Tax=Hubei narna-like virus 15 TaxID=1922945 RepID=UPI00090C9E49|nr:RNA-dependent RNA polymerase [Hubei narna-like virus 15]APG77150.1 RNA-dependent RNA polymerase [Hubei narna-like virus 15]
MALTYELCMPVFNGDALRVGSIVNFFCRRSCTYPARQSDGPKCPKDFISREILKSSLPHFRVPGPACSHKLRRRLAQTLNAFAAAFISVWPSSQFGLCPTPPNLTAMWALCKFLHWVCKVYVGNGEPWLAPVLRGIATWARYHASTTHLHLPPEGIFRTPLSSADGSIDFGKLFTGSISRKATSPSCLLRFSRFARALPPGDDWTCAQGLVDHQKAMRDNPTVPEQLTKLFKDVATRISCQPLLKDVGTPGFTLSMSSCLERTRSQGGAAEEVKEAVWEIFPGLRRIHEGVTEEEDTELSRVPCLDRNPLYSDVEYYYSFYEGLPEHVPRVERLTYLACCEKVFPPCRLERRVPSHRIIPVPDRGGFKIRVITAGEALTQSLAHQVRKVVYRKVLPTLPTVWGIREDGVRNFIEQLRMPSSPDPRLGRWVALSCDMKAATDRFPHPLIEAINDGLESNLSESQRRCPAWLAWRSLSGPQRLLYPGGDVVLSSCGNLMGTAPSWALLNMYNYALFRLAWSIWSTGWSRRKFPELAAREVLPSRQSLDGSWEPLKSRVLRVLSDSRFHPWNFPKGLKFNELAALVGDDLAAACPFGVAMLYELILELCNGKPSAGKHYVMPWIDGSYLLLAEEFGFVKGDRLVHLHAEFLRGIVTGTNCVDTRSRNPEWAQIGLSLAASIAGCRNETRRALSSFSHLMLADLRKTLLRFGLPIYLPASVGGLGWPHPRGLEYALERTSAKVLRAYSVVRGFRQDPVQFILIIARLRSSWMRPELRTPFSNLLSLLSGYFRSLKVSRDEQGRLAPCTPESPIGLPSLDGTSKNFFDCIDSIGVHGVTVAFVAGEELPLLEQKERFRTIGASRRAYGQAISDLLRRREGHVPPLLPRRSDYAALIAEDEKLVRDCHLYLGESLEAQLPFLQGVLGKSPEEALEDIGEAE